MHVCKVLFQISCEKFKYSEKCCSRLACSGAQANLGRHLTHMHLAQFFQKEAQLCLVLIKLGIIHVRKVSSQISLCGLNLIFGKEGLP